MLLGYYFKTYFISYLPILLYLLIILYFLYNYSTYCTTAYLRGQYTNRIFTRSVHQPPIYASSALIKHWLIKGDCISI